MTEQSFHEIQLSGKQLVFVFMSAVVVAVGIFLLGVSVGRGVKSSLPGASTTAADAGPATEPVPAPAATPAPGDPTYHEILQGKDGKGAATPPSSSPAPASTPPAVAPPVIPPPAPPAAEKSAPKAADTKADSKSAKAADAKGAKAAEPKAGDWFVQTGVFRTKEAADKQVQQLKAKAYSAFVSPESSPEPRFRVRIGPFVQKGDAERMAARLAKEGQTPFVTR